MQSFGYVKSTVLLVIGGLNLLIGLIFLPLPPPFFGFVFIAIGLPMLAAGSKRVRRYIQYLRWRYRDYNHRIEKVLGHLPEFIRTLAHNTAPHAFERLHAFKAKETPKAQQSDTREDVKEKDT